MGDFHNDEERCAHQIKRLEALQCAHTRRRMLLQLEERRRRTAHERDAQPAHDDIQRREGDGIERPALALAFQRLADLDPVLIVRDEILVADTEVNEARRLLEDHFEEEPDDGRRLAVEGRAVRLVPSERNRRERIVNVPDAVLRLVDSGVRAGANHVAMLGGRDKGGTSPEPTDHDLGDGATSSDGPLVVVIDTGIDAAAPVRTDGWLDGVDPVDPITDVDLLDRVDAMGALVSDGLLDLGAGHGTFVAGVVRQVAPHANVQLLRALDTEGLGTETMIADTILRAAELFHAAGGRGVLNLSLGMETLDGQEPVALRLALDALPPDVLVVAAAGNARSGIRLWPAASKRVLAVGSHRGDDELTPSSWSNYGSWLDFSARGECVVSTFVAGTETGPYDATDLLHDPDPDTFVAPDPVALWTGTSFSAPQVAGRLANLLADDPAITRAAAQQQLQLEGRFSAMHGYRLDILPRQP